jgi:hypothetical protein
VLFNNVLRFMFIPCTTALSAICEFTRGERGRHAMGNAETTSVVPLLLYAGFEETFARQHVAM